MSSVKELTFSGREEDFEFFSERFEARLAGLKLVKYLTMFEPTGSLRQDKLDAFHTDIWYELVQCVDRKSLKIIRSEKPNGALAWQKLLQHFKSSERPRLHQLFFKMTNLKLLPNESIHDYLTRAEDLQLDLENADEQISDQMLCSFVLKGLPKEYENLCTLFKFSKNEKTFEDLKLDLINFANDRKSNGQREIQGAYQSSPRPTKCFKCGKLGHTRANCRSAAPPEKVCFECGNPGHFARDCRSFKPKFNTRPTQKKFETNFKRNETHSTVVTEQKGFSFNACNESETFDIQSCADIIVDSGCTTHMFKDEDYFKDLILRKSGSVACANASFSQIEGFGTVEFTATDDVGVRHKIELKNVLYVPEYSKNLVSVKKIVLNGGFVKFDDESYISSENVKFPLVEENSLYYWKVEAEHHRSFSSDIKIWHQRLGHNNYEDLRKLKHHVDGLPDLPTATNDCDTCDLEKSRRSPISNRLTLCTQAFSVHYRLSLLMGFDTCLD